MGKSESHDEVGTFDVGFETNAFNDEFLLVGFVYAGDHIADMCRHRAPESVFERIRRRNGHEIFFNINIDTGRNDTGKLTEGCPLTTTE